VPVIGRTTRTSVWGPITEGEVAFHIARAAHRPRGPAISGAVANRPESVPRELVDHLGDDHR
jgi:hypothetical protein